MNKPLYGKLALSNIKKNGETYFPYILTCISSIIMFYIMHSISINKGLDKISGADSLKNILSLGSIVIAIFSVIFLFYTNSFLIKRRKKELGLYNILGMEKKHIARMLVLETLIISFISMVFGLFGGVVISKLMYLVLLKMLNFSVSLSFSISVQSIIKTLLLFIGIFFVTLSYNLGQIHLAKPIELLKGSQTGEKEPKTKWFWVIVGIISLGAGYYISLTTESPLQALQLFFVAVVLVMIGTYALFTVGSIAILKLLRKNHKFYYKTKNFISVSGMIYRMKQNAVGLANICILSTAVLITLSTTVSLYIGVEDILQNLYPQDVIIENSNSSEVKRIAIQNAVMAEVDKNNVIIRNMGDYRYKSFRALKDENRFTMSEDITYSNDSTCLLIFIPLAEYTRIDNSEIKLNNDEVMIFSTNNTYGEKSLNINGQNFKVKKELDQIFQEVNNNMDIVNQYYIIINREEIIQDLYHTVEDGDMGGLTYTIGFDIEGSEKNIEAFSIALKDTISNQNTMIKSKQLLKDSIYAAYGGLFFIGIFLGVLFLMATALIIYYKQVSEGYQDKERFQIMQKVGMDRVEIKRTIRSQILMIFFLPLVVAVTHISFAFKVITKLLRVFGLDNVPLFMVCTIVTILIFALIYAAVYLVTTKAYYKIVR